MYDCSLFIFRRDLRLKDNRALNAALEKSKSVIPIFILDPVQVGAENPYRGNHSLTYMVESLETLRAELRTYGSDLWIVAGAPEKALRRLFVDHSVQAVWCNADYTPYSGTRDAIIKEICVEHNVGFHQMHDALLVGDPASLRTQQDKPYQIFTAFWRAASARGIEGEYSESLKNLWTDFTPHYATINFLDHIPAFAPCAQLLIKGGEKHAHKLLLSACATQREYAKTHDIPSINTSLLAAPLKFGTVSIRTAYHTLTKYLGVDHPLVRQLYWRDFFTYVAYHKPPVFGHAYHEKYNNLEWDNDPELWRLWTQGETGFPLVDAGMRQLNETGFMHNRVRMVTASFLIKDLHIDWRAGERYFAQQLTDYDPAVNNGNWQWVASTGCDAMPYIRVFNPWLQQKKFDAQATYIKQWVPELRRHSATEIHGLAVGKSVLKGYPKSCVDHSRESKITIARYRKIYI